MGEKGYDRHTLTRREPPQTAQTAGPPELTISLHIGGKREELPTDPTRIDLLVPHIMVDLYRAYPMIDWNDVMKSATIIANRDEGHPDDERTTRNCLKSGFVIPAGRRIGRVMVGG